MYKKIKKITINIDLVFIVFVVLRSDFKKVNKYLYNIRYIYIGTYIYNDKCYNILKINFIN